ncbi:MULTISPECIES: amidohydrolase family protein [Nitrincola]|uniref:Putative metal-dependent hydrolase of the TIM-barrel fold protein n=1 Tax=Nitrincola nitratireducens TaxID=1229521 RepID=W9UZK2_9GAMM|nr:MULTISPECIES: amidohydrolase family protein [Nitrincola]EXJ10141.1 putative metal-dependent hydrolase of the TIM-barrel fold protein [Nitrincola nitratireducens]
MIIDCHGHYTTTPPQVGEYREKQKALLAENPDHIGEKGQIIISDDEIRESIEKNQLRLQRERGTDMTIFSPRASWMGHHIGNEHTSRFWTEQQNDLIRRVCDLYPQNFAPVAQLPQSPGVSPAKSVAEIVRTVEEMGFIGINLNPDPSGGFWNDVSLSDRAFYPIYEKMVEYDIPAMVHVSASCNSCFHTTGSHYLGADTTAFQQLMMSDVFKDFPTLKIIIPHGGGAVPYHWGRFRGLAQDAGLPPLEELVLKNVFFDTCVYHQKGIDLLLDILPVENILFASEMIGAVRGIDPETGHYFDDTKRYIDNNTRLNESEKAQIFEHNIRRVFSRLKV